MSDRRIDGPDPLRGRMPSRGTRTPRHPAAPVPEDPTVGADSVDLLQVLGTMRRQALLVSLVTLLGGAVAFAIAMMRQPVYEAYALIRMQDSRFAMTRGITGDESPLTERTTLDPILSEIQILTSHSLAAEVVDRPGAAALRVYPVGFSREVLADVDARRVATRDSLGMRFDAQGYVVAGTAGTEWAEYGSPVELGGLRFTVTERPSVAEGLLVVVPTEEAVDSLLRNLAVWPRERTNLIDVRYAATDPVVARDVANAAVEVFETASASSAQEQARRRRLFIEQQLAQNDSLLQAAQNALSAYRGRQRSYSTQDRFAVASQAMASLQIQRVTLEAERRTYETLLDDLTRAAEDTAGERLRAVVLAAGARENPVISQLYLQLMRYRTTYDSLTTGDWRNAQSSPDVQRMQTLIGSTREQLVSAVRSYTASLEARLAVLDGLQAASSAPFTQLPAAEVEEAQLAMRLDALRPVSDQLRSEYQKARIAEAVQVGRLQIVDLARLPSGPVGLGLPVLVALGLAAGFGLGALLGLLRVRLTSTIQGRDDLEQFLQLPRLAVIPRIRSARSDRAPDESAALEGPIGGGRLRNFLGRGATTLAQERAIAADAFRLLRINMLVAHAGSSPRVIAVTSTAAQEGKTTTAFNLAAAMAEQEQRVLVVDCDFRRPRLHRLVSVERTPGLTDLIEGDVLPEEAIRPLANRIAVLPAGTMPRSISGLLDSGRMRDMIQSLACEYDVLVLDCPPTLLGTDAVVLSRLADAVLFVVRAGHTSRDAAASALQQLHHVGAPVVGAALNDPESRVVENEYTEAYAVYRHYFEPHDGPRTYSALGQ